MKPIVIAHRGSSGYVPEHTLLAKGVAHAMGADFLEQDVVSSKDGVPVVLHDVHLDTVTDVAKKYSDRNRSDGRYYAIDFTVDELKTLRVFERFDPVSGAAVFPNRYPTGEGDFRIPTLDEELRFIENLNRSIGREAGIYPEIKRPAWHREQGIELSQLVLDVLAKYGYADPNNPCYVQCFDDRELRTIRDRMGYRGRLIQLIDRGRDEESGTDYEHLKSKRGLAELSEVVDGIGPSIADVLRVSTDAGVVASDLTAAAHAVGLLVHPWTFRSDDLPSLISSESMLLDACFRQANVDGLFTDQPDRVVAYLQRLSEQDR